MMGCSGCNDTGGASYNSRYVKSFVVFADVSCRHCCTHSMASLITYVGDLTRP